MPARARSIGIEDVPRYVRERCVRSSPERRVGLEVEWLAVPAHDPTAHAPFDVVERVARAAPRPGGSTLTFEPGGQIELSSPPLASVAEAIAAVRTDAGELRTALARDGLHMRGAGVDARPVRRVRDDPRYRAMEAFFDVDGFAGRRMMCGTASVQMNLDLGDEDRFQRRWRLAHAIGPMLSAAFANSPLVAGAPSGWRSTRMANWWAMDAGRTAPVPDDGTFADAWARYALRANVMLVRRTADDYVPVAGRMPFARWITDGHELGYPTVDDLAYHLTTLFPPVRLRGWIELRMIDALPDEWWPVAAAVSAALLDDDEAADVASRACADTASAWLPAFRYGLAHDGLARAARTCFDAALDALPRMALDTRTIADAARFADRYIARGRCPADDVLDARRRERVPAGAV